jgi:ferric-dicitrate binding protein FerR (iron transport regulator)
MKNNDNINEATLLNYFLGEVADSEKLAIKSWINASPENNKMAKEIYATYLVTEGMNKSGKENTKSALLKIKGEVKKQKQARWRSWLQRGAAILFIPLLCSTLYFAMDSSEKELDQFIEIRTNSGMVTSVTLPDSSKVWLNSESYLKYPVRFGKKSRDITLNGEAYFSVKKHTKKFIVKTLHNAEVEVLGTEFNLEAYETDKSVITTLVSGSVNFKFETEEIEKSLLLTPGKKIVYNTISKEAYVANSTIDDTISWKDGRIIFDNTPLERVLSVLSKRFNVDFIITSPGLKDNSFTGEFAHQQLSRILEYFERSSNLKFRYLITKESLQEKSRIEIY